MLHTGGEFLAHERNVVLVGGTGTGKSHLAIAIARAGIRTAPVATSSTSSTSSTGSKPRPAQAARAACPITCRARPLTPESSEGSLFGLTHIR